MPFTRKPIEIPPKAARRFQADMQAFYAEREPLRRDEIAACIRIRPDDRVLKTSFSWRDIPLVGISLEALRRFPKGFPQYRDNGDAFSARP